MEANGSCSDRKRIIYGVLQGSILGPLLFLCYIKDLPRACSTFEVLLFADDTNLTSSNSEVSNVQKDLVAINTWLNANKLNLIMKKTAMMIIGKRASNCNFRLNDNDLETKPVCKYLGILIDNKLSYQA